MPPSDGRLDVPVHVPARMVNEFVYCPRLFYLEWVSGQFEDNADTVDGRFQHRAVDVERGRMPSADDSDLLREARSVTLGSERLGLIAIADILEGDRGEVIPVEVKRGQPPRHGPAWEPELIQLCVVAILLRDNGYRCERGEFYFATTRERRQVEFDDALVGRTLDYIAELRRVAEHPLPPPPLVDSPKCPRCSLVSVCLPDETNHLVARSEQPPRRLTPRDSAARPLYVTEQGSTVGCVSGRLQIRKRDEVLQELRLLDVSQVNIYGQVSVTPSAISNCLNRSVPILWFSHGGWFRGLASGLPSAHVELRRRQVFADVDGLSDAGRRLVEGKIRNCRTLLMRNAQPRPVETIDSLKRLAAQTRTAETISVLLGIEGAAARMYFQHFNAMLKVGDALPGGPFSFERRSRRPPADAINCLLSYVYGLLAKDLTVTAAGVGFDPFIGVYHRPRFGRPALALDLAEEFRPLIGDSTVISMLNNREVRPSDFIARAGGVGLTASGRRAVIAAYERRMDTEVRHPTFGYTITYRRVLEVQARVLAAHLLGELPHYTPFTTR